MKKLVLLAIVSFSFLCYFGCSDDPSSPEEENYVEVNLPLNKTAVYASAWCHGEVGGDSLDIFGVSIFSLQFDSIEESAAGKKYFGKVGRYDLIENGAEIPEEYSGYAYVTIDDNWVIFQSSDVGAEQIFLKTDSTVTDTLPIPSRLEGQFPVYPKKLIAQKQYSAFRPENPDSFGAVQRDFETGNIQTYSDYYGTDEGIYSECYQTFETDKEWIIKFQSILDSHGIITSNMIFVNPSENPMGPDSLTYATLNRRLEDYTDPENIKELSWYAEQVMEYGIEPLE